MLKALASLKVWPNSYCRGSSRPGNLESHPGQGLQPGRAICSASGFAWMVWEYYCGTCPTSSPQSSSLREREQSVCQLSEVCSLGAPVSERQGQRDGRKPGDG